MLPLARAHAKYYSQCIEKIYSNCAHMYTHLASGPAHPPPRPPDREPETPVTQPGEPKTRARARVTQIINTNERMKLNGNEKVLTV